MAKMDPNQIQSELAAQPLGWEAADNDITMLDEADQDRLLGYAPDPASGEMTLPMREQHAAQMAAALAAARSMAESTAEAAPAAIDLRAYDGGNYITPIKDQRNCGSCVAFASLAAVESAIRLIARDPGLAVDLSENHLFNGIARGQGRTCGNGWWVTPALTAVRDLGVVDEGCSPYSDADQPAVLCPDWQARLTRIRGFQQVNAVADMKASLSQSGALVAGFTVYSDFFAYRSGVYRRLGSAQPRGGHCIAVVGYDDAAGAWICKNSWGAGWGEQGFFRIAYGECGIDAAMWSVAALPPPVAGRVPLYRYWNNAAGDHFYTTNWGELGGGRQGWAYEGVQCLIAPASAPGLVPLFRYWNAAASDHFYTTNWSELGGGRHGWAYEGVQGWVSPTAQPGALPLYRYWNPRIGDHFYTTNWSELGGGGKGWGYEGVQCYVWPAPQAVAEAEDAVPASFRLLSADTTDSTDPADTANTAEPTTAPDFAALAGAAGASEPPPVGDL